MTLFDAQQISSHSLYVPCSRHKRWLPMGTRGTSAPLFKIWPPQWQPHKPTYIHLRRRMGRSAPALKVSTPLAPPNLQSWCCHCCTFSVVCGTIVHWYIVHVHYLQKGLRQRKLKSRSQSSLQKCQPDITWSWLICYCSSKFDCTLQHSVFFDEYVEVHYLRCVFFISRLLKHPRPQNMRFFGCHLYKC